MEEAGPVDAFDARHFDVGGGAGAGDIGSERGRLRAASKVFGQSLDDLAGAQDAQMPIGQKRKDATAFGWPSDAARLCPSRRPQRKHAVTTPSQASISAWD